MPVRVKYQCKHISCKNPQCYVGEFLIDKDRLKVLKDAEAGELEMRSPAGQCKIGTPQIFEILDEQEEEPVSDEERALLYKKKMVETARMKEKILKQKREVDRRLRQVNKNLKQLKSKLEEVEPTEED